MRTSQRHGEIQALRFEVKVWEIVDFVTAVAVCFEEHGPVWTEVNNKIYFSVFTKVLV